MEIPRRQTSSSPIAAFIVLKSKYLTATGMSAQSSYLTPQRERLSLDRSIRHAQRFSGAANSIYAEQAAAMIRVSRFRTPSARAFADLMRRELGWGSLSRQAVYDWEAGRSRVPAVAILAAASVIDVSVGELSSIADRFRCAGAVIRS
jgi:hypothetical protein